MKLDSLDDAFSLLQEAGLEKHMDLFKGRILEAVRIDAKPYGDESIPIGGSKFGGRPDLPENFAWPRIKRGGGNPLSFVAQINLGELKNLDKKGLLPSSGLLTFFVDPTAPWDQLGKVGFVQDTAHLIRREAPEGTTKFSSAKANFRSEISFPNPFAESSVKTTEGIPLAFNQALGSEEEIYADLLKKLGQNESDRPQHRMLGNPNILQAEDLAPAGTRLLLQVDSDPSLNFQWGDNGRLYFVISEVDLQGKLFDKAYMAFDGL